MSLVTPLEPGSPRGKRAPRPAIECRQAVHTTVFGRIVSAVASSCGSVHGVNEDAHSGLTPPWRLFVVADGVGGGAMASLASRELVAHLHATLDGGPIAASTVADALLDADRAIAERIAEATDAPGAATVALCAATNVFSSRWLVAWVGDCRVYRVHSGRAHAMEALTRDDTFDHLKETPPAGSATDDPARMIGNGAVSQPNVMLVDVARGDLLVLCSDGVHKHVAAGDWQRVLSGGLTLARQCEELIVAARANGSTDDATVLLVQRGGAAR
ncbi:MAG TPA: PP2C family serine/threonine-protein phosphatase [Albitalea sp.]|jgi:protein phosphatase|nr:PP2C family serine/threonine-protein phosphatase [Albitalea sp.]